MATKSKGKKPLEKTPPKPQLALDMHEAEFFSFTPNKEKSGKKKWKPNVTVGIRFTVPNDMLDIFGKGLRKSHYHKSKSVTKIAKGETPPITTTGENKEPAVEPPTPVSSMPDLLNPELDPTYHLKVELENYRFIVHQGPQDTPIVTMIGCKLHSISYTTLEGGSVEFAVKVYSSEFGADLPSETLHHLLREKRPITLTPLQEEIEA